MVLNMVTIKAWKDFFPYPRKGLGYDGVMSEPVTPLLAAIKGLASLIPEAAGSAVALRLNTIPLKPIDRMFSFACGVALAHYVGGAAADYLSLSDIQADASKVVVGIFGLNFSASITAQIPDVVQSLKKRIFGGSE